MNLRNLLRPAESTAKDYRANNASESLPELSLLTSWRAATRSKGLDAIQTTPTGRLQDELVKIILSNDTDQNRKSAVTKLGRQLSTQNQELLLGALETSRDPSTRSFAVEALWKEIDRTESTTRRLAECLLKETDKTVRHSIAESLIPIRSSGPAKLLIEALKEKPGREDLKADILRALSLTEIPSVHEALWGEITKNPEQVSSVLIAKTLSNCHRTEPLNQKIVTALSTADVPTRLLAAIALSNSGYDNFIQAALRKALIDKDSNVRRAAADGVHVSALTYEATPRLKQC